MAKPTFPLTVRRGAVAVKIYYTPVRTNVTPGDADPKKQYDAYTLVYTFGGERRRLKFHDLQEARSEAELAASQIANGQMAQVHLSPKQAGDYLVACQKAQELGFDLMGVLTEFAEAKKLLPEVHLVQAAQFYKRYRADEITDIEVSVAVKQLVGRKREQGVVGYYLQDLSAHLGKFAEQFPGVIAGATTAEIDTWLKSLGLEPRTRNNYRAAVLQLFNFARTSLKALPHWLPHAAEGTIRVKEPSKDTEIYLPAEIRRVLSHTRPELAVLRAGRSRASRVVARCEQ